MTSHAVQAVRRGIADHTFPIRSVGCYFWGRSEWFLALAQRQRSPRTGRLKALSAIALSLLEDLSPAEQVGQVTLPDAWRATCFVC